MRRADHQYLRLVGASPDLDGVLTVLCSASPRGLSFSWMHFSGPSVPSSLHPDGGNSLVPGPLLSYLMALSSLESAIIPPYYQSRSERPVSARKETDWSHAAQFVDQRRAHHIIIRPRIL